MSCFGFFPALGVVMLPQGPGERGARCRAAAGRGRGGWEEGPRAAALRRPEVVVKWGTTE